MFQVTRRLWLRFSAFGLAAFGWGRRGAADRAADSAVSRADAIAFSRRNDGVFLGGEVWANPMEDWEIQEGRAVCISKGGNRSVHSIVHQWDQTEGDARLSVRLERVEAGAKTSVGFRVGMQSEIEDYRANCFRKNGLNAGIQENRLMLAGVVGKTDLPVDQPLTLTLLGKSAGGSTELVVSVADDSGKVLDSVSKSVPTDRVLGNVGLVNSHSTGEKELTSSRYAFGDWTITGSAISVRPERAFGPILWTMYTVHDSLSDDGTILKLSALTGPIGVKDPREVQLQLQSGADWETVGTETLDPDAFTATFKIKNYDASADRAFRVVLAQKARDGSTLPPATWSGTVKANPVDRPLRCGMLTCQNDYGFPYAPVADNLVRIDPDLLYFSGDQLYENHGGFGIIRNPADRAILNYLRKFYQFGWAFREAMRDRPTVCIPDDHDVFQGNIWGEGGMAMAVDDGGASSNGGYIQPARMVNAVHRTNAAHHPDPYDSAPCKQDISVYYGTMLYGGVSFAILGDRQWKSGPHRVDTGDGRADHVTDRQFDTASLDVPGLELLGERQEAFLEEWVDDWNGHQMKVLLSQTVFSGVATHHGSYDGYLKADLDSSGWPQTPRNRAIKILRRGKVFHVNGDQHLATMSQYGVDAQRDGGWSFCVPAISAGYPRWWRPDECEMPHENRPEHGIENTGEYLDGFGNRVYVYAHGNPQVGKHRNRYRRAHQKGSGFGLVTIDSEARTYHCEAFRFLCDASNPKPEDQFTGWPITIHQDENAGENRIS